MNLAAILLMDEIYYIYPYFQTTAGLSIAGEPIVEVDQNSPNSKIAEALLKALEMSKNNVPHPVKDEWKNIAEPVLRALNVKSWNVIYKKAYYCTVVKENAVLKILPKKRGIKGFVNIKDMDDIEVDTKISTNDLGHILVGVFDELSKLP
jgi:hypothetical protein